MTNHQAEKQLRQAADVVISNLPTIDVADEMQASAHAALGELQGERGDGATTADDEGRRAGG